MRAAILALAALVALAPERASAEGKPGARRPNEFKSVDCPEGDVYLILERDGSFVLVLDRIDRKLGTSLGQEKITGKWQEAKAEVKLVAKDAEIVYAREPTSFRIGDRSFTLEGLRWVRSTKHTFADSWMLVDRLELEKTVVRWAPAPPGK